MPASTAQPMTADQWGELAGSFMRDMNKKFGENTVMRANDNRFGKVAAIPTGSPLVDLAIGVGGLPCGRIVEIYGPESSGKTTLALSVIAQALARDPRPVLYVDVEMAIDESRMRQLGITDSSRVFVTQPEIGEDAMDLVEEAVGRDAFSVVVLDSIAALAPKAEIESDSDTLQPGAQARLMSSKLRKLLSTMKATRTTTLVLMTNQLREKIGVMYGNPEIQPGGRAMKFYASVRLEMRRVGNLLKDETNGETIGQEVKIKVVKNKVAAPGQVAEGVRLMTNGFDAANDLIELGKKIGIISARGAYYTLAGPDGELPKMYRKELRARLTSDRPLYDWLYGQVMMTHGETSAGYQDPNETLDEPPADDESGDAVVAPDEF